MERKMVIEEMKKKNDIWAKENGYENIDEYYKKRDYCLNKHIENHKHGSDYKRGELDPNSSTGFAFISQRVVAKVLGLDIINDCNCEFGFNFKYDLYDEGRYYNINVKASTLYNDTYYNFGFNNIYQPDTYVITGFSTYKEDILHVWIVKSDIVNIEIFKRVNVNFLGIYKKYEVNAEPYNNVYHNMSIENCKVLRS